MEREEILKDLSDLTQKMMHKEGIRVYELTVEGQSNKGDNYVGDITFFTITSEENEKKFRLVMKTAKRSEEIRRIMANGKLYSREIYMYSEVFPNFQELRQEVSNSQLENIPEVYWVSSENKRETIVMDNLKAKGYKLWNRTKPMNLEHILLVLKNYGEYHGFSMALKYHKPELFRKLTEDLDNVMIDFCKMNNFDSIFGSGIKNAVQLLKEAGRKDLDDKFQIIMDNLENEFMKETEEDDKLVITHGDCWTNNMLFQYEHGNHLKPEKMCFLDFQLSTFDSPVKDLSYYIYACCDKFALDQLDLLLTTYYDSLSSTMSELGCPSEPAFTLEKLKQHWKKYAVYGLMLATLLIKLSLSSSEEAPDIDELRDEKDLANALDIKIADVDAYNRRILDACIHFGDTCL